MTHEADEFVSGKFEVMAGTFLAIAGLGLIAATAAIEPISLPSQILNQIGVAALTAGILEFVFASVLKALKRRIAQPYVEIQKMIDNVQKELAEASGEIAKCTLDSIDGKLDQIRLALDHHRDYVESNIYEKLEEIHRAADAEYKRIAEKVDKALAKQ